MDKNYKNIILTDHATDRLQDRSVAVHNIWDTVNKPAKRFDQGDGTTKFIKSVNDRKIHVVATFLKNEKKWLVISTWVRGEDDKLPLVWQLLTLPFKLTWFLIKLTWKFLVWVGNKKRKK